MNWLFIVVAGIIIIGGIVGLCRGAVRISLSLIAVVATLVIVFFATPYVSSAIKELTPVDELIESQCLRMMARLSDKGGNGQMTEERVRNIMEGSGITEETLESHGITVEDIVEGKVSSAEMAELGISSGIWKGHNVQAEEILDAEVNRQQQIELIENSKLPEVFKDLLLSNNNNEVYERLGAANFVDYIAKYMTDTIIRLLAFLLTFVIVTIFMRAIIFALDFVAELPVLGFFNHLFGLGIGIVIAVIIVDLLFMLITLLYATETGLTLNRMINDNEFLTYLYNHNYLMNLATQLR